MTHILLHMNQPHSICCIEFENCLKCSWRHQKQHLEWHLAILIKPDTTIPPSLATTLPSIETQQDFDWNLNTPNTGGGNGAGPPSDSKPYLIELYSGATEIYGCGQTFMDKFDADEFSCHRNSLPYYPFASQDEWELASFLLWSDLSMSMLDEFFKLSMVSTFCHTDILLNFSRSSLQVSAYHSNHQRHYKILQSSSHSGWNGNVKQ